MQKERYTTPDLKGRGWTVALISTFLSEPDSTCPNPRYPNAGSSMKLYAISRVEMVESTKAFKEAMKKSNIRKAAAKRGVQTKLARMDEYLKNLKIEIVALKDDELVAAAKANFKNLDLPPNVSLTIERQCVNFLRHCETDYEAHLQRIAGNTGSKAAYYEIKHKVLQKIEEVYPWLFEECTRQMRELSEQFERSQYY